MNLQEIRDYIRLHIDIEADDLPDELLDVFIREGSKRVERAETRWPFYETEWTLPTEVGNRGGYPIDDIADEVDDIAAIETDRWQLSWVGFDQYTQLNPQDRETQSRPRAWAEWANHLWFWPTPDAVYDLKVRGYRTPTDWVVAGSGAEPDFPDDLHNCVATWALSRAYVHQEDPELAAIFERQAIDELNVFRRRIVETPHHQPLVIGGDGVRISRWPRRRMLFSFDV